MLHMKFHEEFTLKWIFGLKAKLNELKCNKYKKFENNFLKKEFQRKMKI